MITGDAAPTEREIRERIALLGRSLYERGYGCGSSGNISVRLPHGMLITPTNSCLGRLDPDRIALIDRHGRRVSGDVPSKEAFMHLAVYDRREHDCAIVHLHSTYSVAVSCLADLDPADVLPPITAYYVMRVGRLPLVPYFPPGDSRLTEAISAVAGTSRAMLLANHGPVVSAADLDAAVYAAEELEETAKLYLLLRDKPARFLTEAQVTELRERFPT
jgi:ribulose-5-phosphate 4-epimerase/fuculose-1-phosphate aldolase